MLTSNILLVKILIVNSNLTHSMYTGIC